VGASGSGVKSRSRDHLKSPGSDGSSALPKPRDENEEIGKGKEKEIEAH
jgi:hypothetical protein